MSYRSMTIATALGEINHSLFLPAMQRPYVWKQQDIIELFDSLMQGYPVSTFLFWAIEPLNRRTWAIYKFQEQHRQGESWNETVASDGRNIRFVLDGQQRLTSLLIGFRGSYTQRQRYGRRDKASSYRASHLYLDLLKNPADIDDNAEVTAVRYGFAFSDITPRSDHRHLWMKVGDILDLEDRDALIAYRDRLFDEVPERVTADQLEVAESSLFRLHRLAWEEEAISYYTERVQDLERVMAIFIRANEGGMKLSKSDLLMAVLDTTWGEAYVRDEILGLVQRLNKDQGREFGFDKDLVMRACLVVPDLPAVYNVANFTAHNLAAIRDSWPAIRSSLTDAVALAARFGLDGAQLTSTNAIIPIAYYLSRLGEPLDGSSAFDVTNRERIRRWLFSALFNGTFGGNSDQTIAVCRDTIREELRFSRDFPIAKLVDDLRRRRGRQLAFDPEGVRKLLDVRYGQRYTYLALGMLYDGQLVRTSRYHIDHIIPRAAVSEKRLREHGLSSSRIEHIHQVVDRLGNLQLLTDRDNVAKSDGDFAGWLKTRDRTFLEQHMIPDDPALWHPESLLEFVDAREELMREALSRFLIVGDRNPMASRIAAE